MQNSAALDHTAPQSAAVRLAIWEKLVIGFILMAVIFHFAIAIYVVIGNWAFIRYSMQTGNFSAIPYVIHVFSLSGAYLLLRRSKWCLLLFSTHLLAMVTYIGLKIGFSNAPWNVPVGCVLEVAAIYFIVHLLSKGALR